MWIPPSLPMDCRAFSALPLSQARLLSLELLSELHRAPLYTCSADCCAKSVLNSRFFFFLVLSFLTYQNIAGCCVDSVSFQCAICSVAQAGERCSGRGVTRRCGARVRFPIERSMTRQKTDRRYCMYQPRNRHVGRGVTCRRGVPISF